jgi:hypothetical protein
VGEKEEKIICQEGFFEECTDLPLGRTDAASLAGSEAPSGASAVGTELYTEKSKGMEVADIEDDG